jgi:hypothetical protein
MGTEDGAARAVKTNARFGKWEYQIKKIIGR